MAWKVWPLFRTGLACGILYCLLLWLVHDGLDGAPGWQAWLIIAGAMLALAAAVAFMEVRWTAPLWIILWALAAFGFVQAGILWPIPTECGLPGHFCEGVGLDRLVVVVFPLFAVVGSLLGLLAGEWRNRRRKLGMAPTKQHL